MKRSGQPQSLENIADNFNDQNTSFNVDDIMHLQRTLGNQATMRLLQRQLANPLQRNGGDTYERSYSDSDSMGDDSGNIVSQETRTPLEIGLELLARDGAAKYLQSAHHDQNSRIVHDHLLELTLASVKVN